MKIQCDVCGAEQASMLCCADEAVLCGSCDGRIHSANKLAGKHRCFSLHNTSSRPLPLCDICKEKSGFLFCQEDRAIICRECDVPIHTATPHAWRHNRFLLAGIRLSSAPISHTPPLEKQVRFTNNSGMKEEVSCKSVAAKSKDGVGKSISDYLMRMLPGWRVDDFLFDDPAPPSNNADAEFCQVHEALPVATIPWFIPLYVNTPTAAAVHPELQWYPVLGSEEGNHLQWGVEDMSTVPELDKFRCDFMNND